MARQSKDGSPWVDHDLKVEILPWSFPHVPIIDSLRKRKLSNSKGDLLKSKGLCKGFIKTPLNELCGKGAVEG